jgi:hypothetical protein
MNQRLIVIDGKTYSSVNEMPPDVRQKYEQAMSTSQSGDANIFADKDNSGTPDILENLSSKTVVSNIMKFIVDGTEFKSMEDLPPEARAKYEQAMGALDKDKNGVPDFMENMMGQASASQPPSQQQVMRVTTSPPPSTPQFDSSTSNSDTSNSLTLVLAVVVILGLCVLGAAGAWYFFLR